MVSRPLVIYRSVDREGATFSLDPCSRDRIDERFGAAAHMRSRVFITHETTGEHESLRTDLGEQITILLTGLAPSRLEDLGGVVFMDPVTESEVERPISCRSS
jgi:hypothetical protein